MIGGPPPGAGRTAPSARTIVRHLRGAVVLAWDGVDLRKLDIERFRQRIDAVFQDFMSYDLTARENIGLDAEAEHDIPSRLRHHRTGQTSVLISHRLTATDAEMVGETT